MLARLLSTGGADDFEIVRVAVDNWLKNAAAPIIPADNPMSPAKAALGKRLFQLGRITAANAAEDKIGQTGNKI